MIQAAGPYALLILFLVILYGFYKTLSGVRPEHQKKLHVLGPVLLLVPGVLTKNGYIHLLLVIVCVALFVFIFGLLS